MIQIYEQYPLTVKAINFINLKNPSNNVPYHGIDHLFEVFRFSYTIFENDIVCKSTSTQNLNKLEILIAALFHDYNHSTGRLTDSENISNAILGLNEFYDLYPYFDLDVVKSIIYATEYPYTISDQELSLEQQIIRDADMCYLFYDLSIVKLYQGLRTEFSKDLPTFLDNQKVFLDNMSFYTDRCQKLWILYKDIRKKELNMLIENL